MKREETIPVGRDISNVRRDILILVAVATVVAFVVLMIANPIVSNLSPQMARAGRLNYVLFSPVILVCLLVGMYWYLRPIAQLASVQGAGEPLPPEVAQRARSLAFAVPIRLLYVPILVTFVVAVASDVFGVLFFQDYSFTAHFPGTILTTIAAACLSVIVSVVSRRILAPVLLITSELAADIGPRFDIRTRQFVTTLLLAFIAVAFLGLLGYNQIVQCGREGLRDKYRLLGESIADDLSVHLRNNALLVYVQALSAGDEGYAFIADERGDLVTEIPPQYEDWPVEAELSAHRNETLIEIPNGEVVLISLNRPNVTWRLGFAYRVDPLALPLVRRTLLILALFVVGMFTFVFITSRYVADDLTRDIQYVTGRLRELAREEQVDFSHVSVLSLDEVGDLILAFNELQAKVQAQTLELASLADNLAAEKSRLDAMLQNIADGLVVTDQEGTVLLVNPAFEHLFGRPAERLVGYPLAQVVTERELQTLIVNALQDVDATFMAEIPLPDGRTLKASSAAIQEGERVIGAVTVLRDISHEKEVDRIKTDFISTVSHELRTPLTSVLGFAKLINKTFAKDVAPKLDVDDRRGQQAAQRISQNLDIIVSEGERLTRLINDVLDIAKMEAGKFEWHDQSLDLCALMGETLDGMRALAEQKGLALEIDLPPEGSLPALMADPDRIRQVIVNLLSNAIKFTPEGWIEVSVSSLAPGEGLRDWRVPPDGFGGVLVSVTDTGVGIPEEEMPRLFQRFQQVGDTLRNKPKGTGLGLAICREIVTHYGGTIWAESSLGVGSTFYFALPLMLSEPDLVVPVVSEIQRRIKGVLPASSERPELLLIVDDEPSIRSLLTQELGQAGYRTLEAANGAEALSLARRYRPDLILLDVMMPDISGFDVTRVLKTDPATASIPILILSIIEDRQRGLTLGADAYLTKPVESDRLLDTIASLLTQEGERPKAIVAGQDRSALEAITAVLRQQGFEVVEAYDPRGAIATVQEVQPDLVVLDEMISRLNDSEILKALRFQDLSRAYTIVVLSGTRPAPEETDLLASPDES